MKKLALLNSIYLKTNSEKDTLHFMNTGKLPETPKELNTKTSITTPTTKQLFKQYKKTAWKLTKQQPIHTLPNYDKRGFKGYHLDHVLSIYEGFKRGLPPETVADLSNLRYIPHKQNTDKNTKTVFTNLFNDII